MKEKESAILEGELYKLYNSPFEYKSYLLR